MNKKILVVDDQEQVRETLLLLLEGQYTVSTAANGLEGMALLDHEHYDLVITDYDMPLVNGYELARHIRRNMPKLPVVMVTGDKNTDLRRYMFDGIIDEFLYKPFSIDELSVMADKFLSL